MSSTLQTDAELLSAFRDYIARQGNGPATFIPLQNHPLHRGVVDAGYVRPAPKEYPKFLYHVSGLTKIVANEEEEKALGISWSESPAKRASDWRDKLNEVFTKSGFRVYSHHVAFLKANGVDVETLKQTADFLDALDADQQESFFRESEEVSQPVDKPEGKSAQQKTKSKAA
jgi:hypothetical protein